MPPTVESVPEEAVAATITKTKSSGNATTGQNERKHSVIDVFAPAEKYYGAQNLSHRPKRTFTFSTVGPDLLRDTHPG